MHVHTDFRTMISQTDRRKLVTNIISTCLRTLNDTKYLAEIFAAQQYFDGVTAHRSLCVIYIRLMALFGTIFINGHNFVVL
jgi:hypothetical protein